MAQRSSKKSTGRTPKPRSPAEIAPGVFVGGWSDAVAFEGKRYCVLDEKPDEELPADEQLRIYDGEKDEAIRPNLDRLASLVDAARERGEPVLLFCGHGIRRAPLAGAWYLHRHDGVPLAEAYARIRAVRPQIEEAREWMGGWKVLEPSVSASRSGR
jgi:protein-tyrosine phosphatase